MPDEITGLTLGSGVLVMLARCDTAAEEEVLNGLRLPEAFLTAGAATVVGSVKEVPADSTAALAEMLLEDGGSADPITRVTNALRAVSVDPPNEETSQWRHPACWAAWKIMTP